MKIVCAVLLAVFFGSAGARCHAQIMEHLQVPDWYRLDGTRQCDELDRMRSGSWHSIYSGGFRWDFDPATFQCISEVNRLFQESEPDESPIFAKALMAMPLLKTGNLLELAIRPRRDIYITVAKRLMLHDFGARPRIQPPEGMTAIDTHVHTCHSPDSLAAVSEMLISAAKRGLDGVAITDHNSFDGAIEAMRVVKKLARKGKLPPAFFVIPGEEIGSSDGHIIGIFLTDEIPAGRSAEWTIREIHRQGGIAIAAHPLLPRSLGKLANTLQFDAVETENAAEELHYALASRESREQRAKFYGAVTKPRIGSSDAHDPQSVGECYTLARCAATPDAVRAAMLKGDVSPAGVSDADETSIVRRGLPHVLALLETASDLTLWIRRVTRNDNFEMRLLPRPVLFFSQRF